MPELFTWLQKNGQVQDSEMYRVFNCGIGMVIVVPADQADRVAATLRAHGEQVSQVGEIVDQLAGGAQTVVV
jgi:phosphoribosylformylglycinamidine cyclo-ligase